MFFGQGFTMSRGKVSDNRDKRTVRRDKRDAFDTEYDSTWEDDDGIGESEDWPSMEWRYNAYRNTSAAKDMQNFRHMLRRAEQKETVYSEKNRPKLPNLLFYQNKIPSQPDGVKIDEFHKEWVRDYDRLEWVHSYIQWLFPIQEQGLNYDSYKLTPEEIKLFRQDKEVKDRLLKSYKLMLDFYGIELLDEKTGKVCRAKNWSERFENLNRNTHNNLRITRILKCLGILGLNHYQAPLVKFFLNETLVNGVLYRVKQSVLDYFMFSVLDKSERKELIKFAFQTFQQKEDFVWCPKRIQRRFLKELKQQTTETNNSKLDSKTKAHKKGTSGVDPGSAVQGGPGEGNIDKNGSENMDTNDDQNHGEETTPATEKKGSDHSESCVNGEENKTDDEGASNVSVQDESSKNIGNTDELRAEDMEATVQGPNYGEQRGPPTENSDSGHSESESREQTGPTTDQSNTARSVNTGTETGIRWITSDDVK